MLHRAVLQSLRLIELFDGRLRDPNEAKLFLILLLIEILKLHESLAYTLARGLTVRDAINFYVVSEARLRQDVRKLRRGLPSFVVNFVRKFGALQLSRVERVLNPWGVKFSCWTHLLVGYLGKLLVFLVTVIWGHVGVGLLDTERRRPQLLRRERMKLVVEVARRTQTQSNIIIIDLWHFEHR